MNSEGPIVHLHSDCFAELRHICLVGANCLNERSTNTAVQRQAFAPPRETAVVLACFGKLQGIAGTS